MKIYYQINSTKDTNAFVLQYHTPKKKKKKCRIKFGYNNKEETNYHISKPKFYKIYSLPFYFEMGRQNKTKCKTEELKSNINKTAFNIYFSSNFVFFVSSARTSCSIVLIFSLT